MPVPSDLRHAPPVRREDRRVDDHVAERDLAEQLEPGHDHPRLPEEDDLARRRVDVARVEARAAPGVSSGQPSVANGQSADENHVSSTSGSRASSREPHSAHASGSRLRARHVPVRAVPDRQLVAPPELARDVPRADRLQPVERDAVAAPAGGSVTRPRLDRVDRRRGQLAPSSHHHCSETSGSMRVPRALAVADRVPVALALLELAVLLAQPVDDAVGGLLLGQPDEHVRDVAGHAAVEADHGQLGQAVVAADLEVDRVVAGRDLQRTGAELALDALVGDHRHVPTDDGHDHLAADELRVALVVGMDGHGDVGEDRRRPHGRDRDVARRRRRAGSART